MPVPKNLLNRVDRSSSPIHIGNLRNAIDFIVPIAIKDVNQFFSKSNSNIRIGLIVEDTRTDPATSLEKLHDLAAKGYIVATLLL